MANENVVIEELPAVVDAMDEHGVINSVSIEFDDLTDAASIQPADRDALVEVLFMLASRNECPLEAGIVDTDLYFTRMGDDLEQVRRDMNWHVAQLQKELAE